MSSQHGKRCLHLNRLCRSMLCPTAGPSTLPPSICTGLPTALSCGEPFPRVFGEARSQTWAVDWCPPCAGLFLHFHMQRVCRVVVMLKEAVLLFMVCLPIIVLLLWSEICFSSLGFFTSFQTHTCNFCQPGCTLSLPVCISAMSLKFSVSPTAACDPCIGGKQEATGKPEDLPEAWKNLSANSLHKPQEWAQANQQRERFI